MNQYVVDWCDLEAALPGPSGIPAAGTMQYSELQPANRIANLTGAPVARVLATRVATLSTSDAIADFIIAQRRLALRRAAAKRGKIVKSFSGSNVEFENDPYWMANSRAEVYQEFDYSRPMVYLTYEPNESSTAQIQPADSKRAEFLESVYRLVDQSKPRHAVDLVIDRLDDAQNEADFSDCDAILRSVNPSRLNDAVIVTFLGITLAAKDKLAKSRDLFYQRAFKVVESRRGTDGAKQLLAKYR